MKIQITLFLLLITCFGVFAQELSIIPKPVQVVTNDGEFQITANTKVIFDTSNKQEKDFATLACEILTEASGFEIGQLISADEIGGNILVQMNAPFDVEIGNEGYKLNIQNDRIFLNANTTAGLFYGIQTLWQMLSSENGNTLPCLEIIDYPRFGWRGLHLDVSRHFMPTKFIYKLIDYLAVHKINVFHWHLVDDQGWRIEIKKYPKLTEIGAWRADREHLAWDARKGPVSEDEKKIGGFYSQKEVKQIVAYAQKKNVTIVPEIEMPAHVMSALAAYPEFSCSRKYHPVPSGGVWPITHIFCAGKDETFNFLEDVLSEVMELFPSTFIHIGGDEATKTEWETCEHCQKRIKDERLKDTHELQSYFITRIEKFLNANGRRMIGWDEILEGGLAPEATVMSWRGEQGGIEAAQMGHDVVMTPGSHCYFDHYQGNPELEPKAWGGFTTLKKVYHYEPVPKELNAKEAKHVLGAQANVWTEYMTDGNQVEYMIMPRISALAEVVWSPKETRDWGDFSRRMTTQYKRYANMGVNYARSAFQVTAHPVLNADNKTVNVSLTTDAWQPDIRYTTDGSEPNKNSIKYAEPFKISETTPVKAVVIKNGERMSKALTTDFFIHKAIACPVEIKFENSPKYNSTGEFALVDGIKGSKNHGDGKWKGFNGTDLVATIDLGESKKISTVRVGFVQNAGSWIFFPTELIVEVSSDGKSFKRMGSAKNKIPVTNPERLTQELVVEKNTSAKYIRVTATNLGECPKGHAGEGFPAWLFVDEIIVE